MGQVNIHVKRLDRMIADYNKMYDTDFSTETWDRYFSDVSKKVETCPN